MVKPHNEDIFRRLLQIGLMVYELELWAELPAPDITEWNEWRAYAIARHNDELYHYELYHSQQLLSSRHNRAIWKQRKN